MRHSRSRRQKPPRRSAASFTLACRSPGRPPSGPAAWSAARWQGPRRTTPAWCWSSSSTCPKGQKDAGRGSDFYAAHDLANFLSSEELAGVRTVAYLPNSIEGHAVLPVIACQEIIMAKDATIGAAGIDEKAITPTLRSAYADIAGRRRTVPVVVALGMLDPALEVLQVETEVDQQYVTPEDLEKLKKEHATKEPVVVKRAGEPFEFSGAEARRLGFASYLAADRREVAKALELPPTAIEEDPSLDGGWRAVRVDLKGPIRADSVDKAQHMIEEQIRDQANFICLWIDSPGGSVADAMQLANFLADLDPSRIRTVAYVPERGPLRRRHRRPGVRPVGGSSATQCSAAPAPTSLARRKSTTSSG